MALTILGVVVIAVGLYDMFHILLHPSGRGPLGSRVLAGVWSVSKASGHRLGSAVGPVAMIAVILLWVLLQGLGWALIYYPHVPGGFTYSPGVDPADYPDFFEAVYISLTTLATLGFGDVVPTDPGIRLAAPVQALTGFALLTAALTWFTQIYPPMSRRRTLALKLKVMADTGYVEETGQLNAAAATRTLNTLAAEIDKVRIDFTQHSEGFYFREQDPDIALARHLPYALRLRDASSAIPAPAVQISAQRLGEALEQLAQKIDTGLLHTGKDTDQIFAAYADDHRQPGKS
ncbi:hypothetical protein JOD47_003145 [Arthrobacter tumbae]|nr:hypothetical protein [Arthrobacter tumbae]